MKCKKWLLPAGAFVIFLLVLVSYLPEYVKAAEPLYLELSGTVVLEGDRITEDIQAGEFEAYIISENKNVVIDENKRPVLDGGALNLGSFTFPQKGTYVFLIKQRPLNKEGYTYDTSEFRIIVDVIERKNNVLDYEITYRKGKEAAEGVCFQNYYKRTEKEEMLVIHTGRLETVEGRKRVVHNMHFENTGTVPLYGIRAREYIPKDAHYVSHVNAQYGAINGREHITQFLSRLMPGESYDISLTYELNTCRPQNYTVTPVLYYEITGQSKPIPVNDPKDPKVQLEYEQIAE